MYQRNIRFPARRAAVISCSTSFSVGTGSKASITSSIQEFCRIPNVVVTCRGVLGVQLYIRKANESTQYSQWVTFFEGAIWPGPHILGGDWTYTRRWCALFWLIVLRTIPRIGYPISVQFDRVFIIIILLLLKNVWVCLYDVVFQSWRALQRLVTMLFKQSPVAKGSFGSRFLPCLLSGKRYSVAWMCKYVPCESNFKQARDPSQGSFSW